MALKETAGLYETLKAEWNKKNPNLSKCGEILSKLKVESHIYVYVVDFMRRTVDSCLLKVLSLLAILAKSANFG